MAMRIYKLANPRGVYFLCEVCNRDATIMCPHCKVTYYCNEKHQQVDWDSVHSTICYLLPSLRSPHLFRFNVSSDPNLKTTLKSNLLKNLIDLTKVMAQQYLFKDCPLMALPAAIRSLHFNHQLHGSGSLQNVPSLLLITESKLGLGHLDQARRLFSQAQWLTIKHRICPDEVLSQLYRTRAKIGFAINDLDKVKEFSSKDIIHCSKKYGPSSHYVAGGYYQLGLAFEREGQIGIFKSLLLKVTDIWMAHLTKMVKLKIYHFLEEEANSKEDSTICLDVAQQAEAMQMLDNIFNKTGSKKAAHCLAMLYFIKDKISLAQKYSRIALMSYNSNFDAENPEYLVTAYQFMAEYEARPVSVGSTD